MKNEMAITEHLRLSTAWVCLDCETIFSILEHQQCPGCGSRFTKDLKSWVPSMTSAGIQDYVAHAASIGRYL